MLPVQELVGALQLGTALNLVLFGINWSQVVQGTNEDGLFRRCLVLCVFVVGAFHTLISIRSCWLYSVNTLIDPRILASSPWSFCLDPVVTAVLAVVVHLTYAHRLHYISRRSWYVPAMIVFFTAAQLGWGCYDTSEALASPEWEQINLKKWAVGSWLGCLAASDILIITTMTYYLRRSRSDVAEANSLLDNLILMMVQNNGLTSAVLFACSSTWHLVPGLALIKFYQISFMSYVNARSTVASSLAAVRNRPKRQPSVRKLDMASFPSFTSHIAVPPRASAHPASHCPRTPSLRPTFLRSLSAGEPRRVRRSVSKDGHEGDSLSVQVVMYVFLTSLSACVRPPQAEDADK
ncbi:hypothetical protein JCM11641_004440 [Rhodosporidiobolus odoratus]